MVCGYIDIQTKQHVIQRADSGFSDKEWPPNPDGVGSSITLYRSSLPTAILRICRLINREAMTVLAPKIEHLSRLPLVFAIDYPSLIALCSPSGPLARPPYHSSPPTSSSPVMLALRKRCQLFLAHKPIGHYPCDEPFSPTKHPTTIHIVITQHHCYVSRELSMTAFNGVLAPAGEREGSGQGGVSAGSNELDLSDARYNNQNRARCEVQRNGIW